MNEQSNETGTAYQTKCIITKGLDLRKEFFRRTSEKIAPFIHYALIHYIGIGNIDFTTDTINAEYITELYQKITGDVTLKINIDFKLDNSVYVDVVTDILINEFGCLSVEYIGKSSFVVTFGFKDTDTEQDKKQLIDNYNSAISHFHFHILGMVRKLIDDNRSSEFVYTGGVVIQMNDEWTKYYLASTIGSKLINELLNEGGLELKQFIDEIGINNRHWELRFKRY